MLCLDNTDTLEGGASVDAVVDYTVHGLVGSTFTVLGDGQLSDTDPSVLYTAGAAIAIVSITLVNTHTAAVNVNLYLDSANGGNPRRIIPKDYSLDISASLHTDGSRITPMPGSLGMTHVEAGCTTARALANNAFTTMIFEVEHDDALGEYDDATGIFTAIEAGIYAVSWNVLSTSTAWAAGEYFRASLSKNNLETEGNIWYGYATTAHAARAMGLSSSGSVIVILAATDTLRVKVKHNQGASINTVGTEEGLYFHIARVA